MPPDIRLGREDEGVGLKIPVIWEGANEDERFMLGGANGEAREL